MVRSLHRPTGMSFKRTVTRTLVLPLLSSLVWAGCEAPPSDSPDLETSSQNIVNGTALSELGVRNSAMVAVYHRDLSVPGNGWWPRPCSGTVVYSLNGVSQVLTARHCVTTNGEKDG